MHVRMEGPLGRSLPSTLIAASEQNLHHLIYHGRSASNLLSQRSPRAVLLPGSTGRDWSWTSLLHDRTLVLHC